ncbi:MAG: HEAT repeat domain-containing protein [Planctomycetaceae bacterium]
MAATLLVLLLLAPDPFEVDFGTTSAQRVRLLRHTHPRVRARAAMLLAHARKDHAIAGLLAALDDEEPAVREQVALALRALGDERAVPFLVRRVAEEGSARVQAACLLALGASGGSYAARAVAPFLEHPVREVRAAAAQALGRLGDASHRAALWAVLRFDPDDPGFTVRSSVLGAFVQLGWREEVKRAVGELEAAGALQHWYARTAIAGAVGRAGLADRREWLSGLLDADEDPRVVAAAADSLARLGERDAVHARLGHASPDVRRAALVALQQAGDPRGVERASALVKEDPDPAVRFEAALVLEQAGHPDADLYLVDALRSNEPLLWITALGLLERRHGRSFGRDAAAWAKWLSGARR